VINRIVFISIIFLTSWSGYAQDSRQMEPLESVLFRIQSKFEITFNYADETIKDIIVIPPVEDLTLQETIEYLIESSNLDFEKLTEASFVISKKATSSIDICGYLYDIDSKQPISGAIIQSKQQAAISDPNGFFTLEQLSVSDTLVLYSLGYELSIRPTSDFQHEHCLEILMQAKVTKLQEVVISSLIINGIDVSSDGTIKINTRKLGILPGLVDPDVLQTLQALPGIQSINETVSDINVRGGTNDQNLIYWDGMKMYQSGHFFGLISAFNPYITQEVNFIKNGTTTALSDGVSSTIDIKTINDPEREFSGSAGINMINADLLLNIPLSRKVSMLLSGRRSISDLIQTPTYTSYFDRAFRNTDVTSETNVQVDSLVGSEELFSFYDVTAKLLADITPRDKLRVSFIDIHNQINYEENEVINNKLESRTSGLEQTTIAGGISYQRLWNENLQTNAQVYLSSYALQATNYDLRNDQRLIQENEVLDLGIKLDARIALSRTFDLLTGYQFFEVGIGNLEDINNPTFRRYIKRVVRSHALFAEGNFTSKSGETNLRIGVRANYYEKFNRFIPEPRLAFNQKFLNHFSMEILGEMKSQTTGQVIDLQNDFLGVEKRRWVLSNEEDIPIALSRQVSAGLRYQRDRFLMSMNGYFKYVDGIISSSQGFQNQFQFIRSAGSYTTSGIDLLIKKELGSLVSWLGYTWADNQYDFPAFSPSVFPNNLDIRHTLTLGSSYQTNKLKISAGLNWRTGKPYTQGLQISDGDIIYGEPNSLRLPEYMRLDVSSVYRWKFSEISSGEFGISIWNLLDNQNVINIFYQIDESGDLNSVQRYALGFTPNLIFRVNF